MIKFIKQNRTKIIIIISLIIAWEIAALFTNPLLLPPFHRVVASLGQHLIRGQLAMIIGQSLATIGLGILVSFGLALGMAGLGYYYSFFRQLFQLLSGILHPLPGIAILPIVILWFGIGFQGIFVIIIHSVVWAIFLNLKLAFDSIPQPLIEVAHNNGASKWQLFRYVLLPSSYEGIRTAAKIGWSRGFRALISAEMIFGAMSSIGGLGWFMYQKRAFGDIEATFAGIVAVAIIGVVVEQLLSYRTKTGQESPSEGGEVRL